MTYNIIKEIIDKADPMGLLKLGAPKDEYDAEIKEIVSQLKQNPPDLTKTIHDIFIKWFDIEQAGDIDKYKQIATEIKKIC